MERKPPPQEALDALLPFARVATALAARVDEGTRCLRASLYADLPDEEARRVDKQLVSTVEASFWANSIAAFADANPDPTLSVIRDHEMAWPEFKVANSQIREERRAHVTARSGRRAAFNHQLMLDVFDPHKPRQEEWPQVESADATNITGTMLHGDDRTCVGVRFHALFGGEDLWDFTVKTTDVATLRESWADTDIWVLLAERPGLWSLGYREASRLNAAPQAPPSLPTRPEPAPANPQVAQRVARGANPVLPPATIAPAPTDESDAADGEKPSASA